MCLTRLKPVFHDPRQRVSEFCPISPWELGQMAYPFVHSAALSPNEKMTSDQVSVVDGVLWKPWEDKGMKGWEAWGHVVFQVCS